VDKLFNTMDRNPGKTIGCIMLINIGLFLGGIAVIAVAARWAITGHVFS
jgi:hypothetical protein